MQYQHNTSNPTPVNSA